MDQEKGVASVLVLVVRILITFETKSSNLEFKRKWRRRRRKRRGKKSYRSSHRSCRHRRSPSKRRNRPPSTSRKSRLPDVGIQSSSMTPVNPLEPVSNASTDISAKKRRSSVGVI
ncbi:unnamed protein product [Rodentolepis nana]|uniref:Arginine/serine-rich protein 1 n=1 Tax=Rodentolepis nana TaxID=102285 RepID=A0A0R3TIH1_RODNA|nr:unnamed protein product [Rodentolepis nana]